MLIERGVIVRLLLLGWTAFPVAGIAAQTQPPNILFIYLDDFGWRDVQYMGSDFYETPHLDGWAAEGMVFRQAYSCAANCAPARASLLSGQYTPRHRIFNVGTRPRGRAEDRKLQHIPGVDTLNPGIRTWAQCLQAVGYRTAIIGKWHLSEDPRPYGFDLNIGGSHSGSPPRGYYPPHPNVVGLVTADENEYLTDRLSAEAIGFIKENAARPWCLYLSHFAVHTPLDAKRELVSKYQQKSPGSLHRNVTMATMIQAVDEGVGKIRQTLRDLGIEDQTAVIFFSDNGGLGRATDMAPLRGYKGTFYEGGIRVPLFFVWPGRIDSGSRCEEPVIGVDFFPTICDIAAAERPRNQRLDGISLVPRLTGHRARLPDRALFWHFPAYLQATAPSPESRDPIFRTRPCGVIRRGRWKLIRYFEDQAIELFDLENDIGESTSLHAVHPDLATRLDDDLSNWQRAIGAPIPQPK